MGALVRMASVEEATRSIEALNNRVPTGGATLQLLVRYADTPEEKRAKRANTAGTSGYGMGARGDIGECCLTPAHCESNTLLCACNVQPFMRY